MLIFSGIGLIGLTVTWFCAGCYETWMRRLHLGQYIRDYGPDIHQKKAGTPTMGGLIILMVFIPLALLWSALTHSLDAKLLFLLGSTLGFGLIGLLDDLLKFRKKESLGLKARHKLLLQLVVALPLAWAATSLLGGNALVIPFTSMTLQPGTALKVIFITFVLIAVVNALNLTDGLDGLATGTTLIMLLPFLVIFWLAQQQALSEYVVLFSLVLLGFLYFNLYPARLFLGDSGAFALGGFLVGLAVLSDTELLLPLIAFVPLVEALSVFAQVTSYHFWKRRIFKVAPLHHHFELARGIDYSFWLPNVEWPEPRITRRFWLVAVLAALLGLLAYLAR